MTADLKQFNRGLDQLLAGRPAPASNPALQAASVLLALDINSESACPADLRARWVARVKSHVEPERETFMMTLHARSLMAMILIALLILLALSGVVYAITRSLGYIPDYGIVDQNVAMLTLAEPISQTRDGVTITIEEMYLTSDKLYSTITKNNIPNNLMLPMTDTTTVTCKGNWAYILPDGSPLSFEVGSGSGTMDPIDSVDLNHLSYQSRGTSKFSTPIDLTKATDLTLKIPCVTSDIPAGSLPENWEFHLHFVPAPEGMIEATVFPVTEFPTPTIIVAATETPTVNPISITKVIDTGDSYILIGEFIPPQGAVLSDRCCGLFLVDGNGQEFSGEWPMDIDPGTPTVDTPFAFTWVRKFEKADVSLPVTIKVEDLHWKSFSVPFEFDAGSNPQVGDEWQVNQPFDVNGIVVTLKTIRVVRPYMTSSTAGYEFYFTFPSYDTMVSISDIQIQGTPSVNSGSSGGGCSTCPTPEPGYNLQVEFNTLFKGKLQAAVTIETVDGQQSWFRTWQP